VIANERAERVVKVRNVGRYPPPERQNNDSEFHGSISLLSKIGMLKTNGLTLVHSCVQYNTPPHGIPVNITYQPPRFAL
jgi:hypothetical protein